MNTFYVSEGLFKNLQIAYKVSICAGLYDDMISPQYSLDFYRKCENDEITTEKEEKTDEKTKNTKKTKKAEKNKKMGKLSLETSFSKLMALRKAEYVTFVCGSQSIRFFSEAD